MKLQLSADPFVRDMIAAEFLEYSLGEIVEEASSFYYFNPSDLDRIKTILHSIASQYKFDHTWSRQEQENWHLAWKENFKSVSVRDQIEIIPDWLTEGSAEHVIRIRPGMAFGTGHHETTWLMLDAMLDVFKPGMTVLDIGSGSGILAIAALKLGAKTVDCIEYDPVCEENFQENLELNGISEKVKLTIADVKSWKDFSHDLILANVNRNVILELIPLLKDAPGKILLSGLLLTDEELILERCKDAGLELKSSRSKGEWICLEVVKSAPHINT